MGYECFEGLTNHAKLDKLNSSLKKRILEYLVDPGKIMFFFFYFLKK